MAATSCLLSAIHRMGLEEAVSLLDAWPLTRGLPRPAARQGRCRWVLSSVSRRRQGAQARRELPSGRAAGASVPLSLPRAHPRCGGALPEQRWGFRASAGESHLWREENPPHCHG